MTQRPVKRTNPPGHDNILGKLIIAGNLVLGKDLIKSASSFQLLKSHIEEALRTNVPSKRMFPLNEIPLKFIIALISIGNIFKRNTGVAVPTGVVKECLLRLASGCSSSLTVPACSG